MERKWVGVQQLLLEIPLLLVLSPSATEAEVQVRESEEEQISPSVRLTSPSENLKEAELLTEAEWSGWKLEGLSEAARQGAVEGGEGVR